MRTLKEFQTVAEFIDLLLAMIRQRPPGAPSEPQVASHLTGESEVEQHVAAAVRHYGGAIVHRSRVWYTAFPARLGLVQSAAVGDARELPWRIEYIVTGPPAPSVPEKVAGTAGKESPS